MPEINTIDKFQQLYFEDFRDFHTTAILCLHTGCPLGALSGTVDFADTGASVKVDQKKKKATWSVSRDLLESYNFAFSCIP